MIALHDCNGDVNRAINVLLEGSPDTVSIGFVWGLGSAGARFWRNQCHAGLDNYDTGLTVQGYGCCEGLEHGHSFPASKQSCMFL